MRKDLRDEAAAGPPGVRPGGGLRLGPVSLNVAAIEPVAGFYERAIGLERMSQEQGQALLGSGGRPVVELREAPGAPKRPPGTTGLFHLAILEPDRARLASRLRALLEAGVPVDGASDHLVSEAVYLRDPEGNGIEIYRDRPRADWDWSGGEVAMATLPLDAASLLAEPEPGADGEPVSLGHVHLNVADLPEAVGFYTQVLGLDLTTGSYPGAAFVSDGGYHHHFGLNTWNGVGSPAPPPGSRGLAEVTVHLRDGALPGVEARAREAGSPVEQVEGGILVTDPSGVPLRLLDG